MRITIPTESENGLESHVSPHFGRCPYYMLIDVENQEIKSLTYIENPFRQHHNPGQIPAFISEQGAEVIIAGGMGRRAINYFNSLGIEAVSGASGTALRSLGLYLLGDLQGAEPCAESEHHHRGHSAVD